MEERVRANAEIVQRAHALRIDVALALASEAR